MDSKKRITHLTLPRNASFSPIIHYISSISKLISIFSPGLKAGRPTYITKIRERGDQHLSFLSQKTPEKQWSTHRGKGSWSTGTHRPDSSSHSYSSPSAPPPPQRAASPSRSAPPSPPPARPHHSRSRPPAQRAAGALPPRAAPPPRSPRARTSSSCTPSSAGSPTRSPSRARTRPVWRDLRA